MKEEIKKMKAKVNSKSEEVKQSNSKPVELEVYKAKDIDEVNVVKILGRGSQSEVF